MSKLFSLTLLGLSAAGLTLITPAAGHAQVPVGVQVRVGPVAVGAGAYPAPVYPAYPYPVYPYPVYAGPPVYYPPVYVPPPAVVVRSGPIYVPYRYNHFHGRRRW